MAEMILVNATVVTGGEVSRVLERGAVTWRDGRLVEVGPESEVRPKYPDADILDAHGGLALPGLVNLHHHFYSALAVGLDPGVAMRNFKEVLDRLWWRLDRAHEAETVSLCAELAVAECVRHGVTTVFDHHASPSVIPGCLDLIANAVESAGLSAVLCYEVSDRNGHDEAQTGLDENMRFLRERREDPRIRGVVGLHASFTLRDDTLELVAERRPQGVGCHIHMAEDRIDIEATREIFGKAPIQRLEQFGLLDRQTLIAHGIHLGPQSFDAVAASGAILIHNPQSNANNGVGHLDPEESGRRGCLVGLGTDGLGGSILQSLKSALLMARHARRDPSAGFAVLPQVLWNNVRAARRFFQEPKLGELVAGAPADLAVLAAPPLTPITPESLFPHLVYHMADAPVRHTVAHGEVVYRDFTHTRFDLEELAARSRAAAPELWERLRALGWGTSFLGDTVRGDGRKHQSPSAR